MHNPAWCVKLDRRLQYGSRTHTNSDIRPYRYTLYPPVGRYPQASVDGIKANHPWCKARMFVHGVAFSDVKRISSTDLFENHRVQKLRLPASLLLAKSVLWTYACCSSLTISRPRSYKGVRKPKCRTRLPSFLSPPVAHPNTLYEVRCSYCIYPIRHSHPRDPPF